MVNNEKVTISLPKETINRILLALPKESTSKKRNGQATKSGIIDKAVNEYLNRVEKR